jgi:nucleotide-binding universal stress UspA family protein
MQKLFNKILVPVDFSKISVRALEKAVEMANEYHCDIYLLHVVTVSPFAVVAMTEGHWVLPYDHIDNRHQLEQELENLAAPYLPMLEEGRKMHNYVVKGLWNDVIIDFVQEHKIDLILVGQRENFFRKRKMLIDANAVAERTFIPVITIPGNRKLVKLYSIVIPVTDFLPVKKLMYGVYMAQHHNTTIKLLGIEYEANPAYNRKVDHYLKKSFQLIRDNCQVPVDIATVVGVSVADAVNEYAHRNAADLVIVNPGRQSRMPGIVSLLTGSVLQKYSIPPVLTISAV